MINPLTRNEIRRINGAGHKFNRFMGVMRYKGGLNNVTGCRAFLAYMDNGFKHLPKVELKAPKGDVARHAQPKRRYDIAGIEYPEGERTGKFVNREEVLAELAELRAAEDAIKLEQKLQREKKEARTIRKKRAKREARNNGN